MFFKSSTFSKNNFKKVSKFTYCISKIFSVHQFDSKDPCVNIVLIQVWLMMISTGINKFAILKGTLLTEKRGCELLVKRIKSRKTGCDFRLYIRCFGGKNLFTFGLLKVFVHNYYVELHSLCLISNANKQRFYPLLKFLKKNKQHH